MQQEGDKPEETTPVDPEDTTPAARPEVRAVEETVEADSASPQVTGLSGRKIGGYTLIQELGHGGQGYVYLAEDERLRRPVALKIMPLALTLSSNARIRFEREAQIASKLDHPGICTDALRRV